MKKIMLFAAPVAALALAACSSDEYLGEGPAQTSGAQSEITFGSRSVSASRADHVGADAAELLNNNFVVEGVKGDGSTQTEVFDHYRINWKENTANTTESNSKDWEYVGVKNHSLSASSSQTIKYWDYTTSQYDFVAFSYGKADSTKAVLSDIKYANLGNAVTGDAVYTVTGTAEELAKTYVADLVTVYNTATHNEYGAIVTPKFRSLGTKVRMAFYETVPGYSVKNVKFYSEAWDETTATTDAGVATATLFAAGKIFPGDGGVSEGTMSVYYPTVGETNYSDPDYNQAHVKFAADASADLVTTKTFGALDYKKGAEGSETAGNIYLGRASNEATYAGNSANNYYSIVLPLGTSDNLQIRVEYDLVPIDGAEETIHVRDARAVVPAAYADWKPNYAYTYIFKISDNTNGWTGVDGNGDVVEGLTPITFDAVVVDSEDGIQETITTVTKPSITTYQEGKVVTAGSEYKAGDVYVSVMNGTSAVTLTDSPANYGVYLVTAGADIVTEAIAQDMLNGVKSNTGITWTPAIYEAVDEVPTADGNTVTLNAAKFAAASGKTYVFDVVVGGKNYCKVIKVQ